MLLFNSLSRGEDKHHSIHVARTFLEKVQFAEFSQAAHDFSEMSLHNKRSGSNFYYFAPVGSARANLFR